MYGGIWSELVEYGLAKVGAGQGGMGSVEVGKRIVEAR